MWNLASQLFFPMNSPSSNFFSPVQVLCGNKPVRFGAMNVSSDAALNATSLFRAPVFVFPYSENYLHNFFNTILGTLPSSRSLVLARDRLVVVLLESVENIETFDFTENSDAGDLLKLFKSGMILHFLNNNDQLYHDSIKVI
jgi:hypothetical protein